MVWEQNGHLYAFRLSAVESHIMDDVRHISSTVILTRTGPARVGPNDAQLSLCDVNFILITVISVHCFADFLSV